MTIPIVNGKSWSSAVAEALKPYGIVVTGYGGSETHPMIALRVEAKTDPSLNNFPYIGDPG